MKTTINRIYTINRFIDELYTKLLADLFPQQSCMCGARHHLGAPPFCSSFSLVIRHHLRYFSHRMYCFDELPGIYTLLRLWRTDTHYLQRIDRQVMQDIE